jgi:hypothetical protein
MLEDALTWHCLWRVTLGRYYCKTMGLKDISFQNGQSLDKIYRLDYSNLSLLGRHECALSMKK